MRFDTLDQWLAWIERAHPSEIELGLERVGRVYRALELEARGKTVTVAGTNGKGSCVSFIGALAQAAGRRVGTYTSPHIHHYCERVRIDGQAVDEDEMCRAFAAVDGARGDIPLTYFEFGTLAALWLFHRHRVDVWVLEVGLGGRLDAVNIVDADIAVITSVALDHQQWLGTDREAIGREKAGIMRERRPVICADSEPPQSLLDGAQSLQAPLTLIGRDFFMDVVDGRWRYRDAQRTFSFARLNLPASSVGAAIAAAGALGLLPAASSVARLGSQLSLPGRTQTLSREGTHYLLDVAHNPAATAHLAAFIRAQGGSAVHIVFAVMADKDIAGVIDPLLDLAERWYPAQLPDVPRAADTDRVRRLLVERGASVERAGSMADCLQRASGHVDGGLVVVCGSFFTVAAALAILAPEGEC